METIDCPYCGGKLVLVQSRYGWQYMCNNFEARCDASVGCHPGTRNPLGAPADKELRKARMTVHKEFDPLWKEKTLTRKEAYKMLGETMGISPEECHIAKFSLEQCTLAYLISVAARSPFPAGKV